MSGTELTPKQRRAIAALLGTGEIQAAARSAGVSRSTLYEWMKSPVFMSALRNAEAEALRDLTRGMIALGKRATGVIGETMADTTANASTRLRAADITIARLLQLRELVDLDGRVLALEEALAASGSPSSGGRHGSD